MWANNKDYPPPAPARIFSTPPPAWLSKRSSPAVPMPASEGAKRMTSPHDQPHVKEDDSNLSFHVIHKVPSGDSPYVRAKHVQLIEKDPGRSISLFWGAINTGDRVDSALKDMAVVMKQLGRSDEAIEAIKSFRHLCLPESQESLDNVLVELYKRSGRIQEQIEMLQQKLKNIEEGIAFGGKKSKPARSQGKKIQITIDQEYSRLLGNLAWAYLQQEDYKSGEELYRKALSFEQDKNKQCNLAICLMHLNKIREAKLLLQKIKPSSDDGEQVDESYLRSYERAMQVLTEVQSNKAVTTTTTELPIAAIEENSSNSEIRTPCSSSSTFPSQKNNAVVSIENPDSRRSADGQENSNSDRKFLGNASFVPRNGNGTNAVSSNVKKSCYYSDEVGNYRKRVPYASPVPASRCNMKVPFTQPRLYNNGDQKRGGGALIGDGDCNGNCKLSFQDVQQILGNPNLDVETQHISNSKSFFPPPSASSQDWRTRGSSSSTYNNNDHGIANNAAILPRVVPSADYWKRGNIWENDGIINTTMAVQEEESKEAISDNLNQHIQSSQLFQHNNTENLEQYPPPKESFSLLLHRSKKSWADLVEEDELESFYPHEEEYTDENKNFNIICQTPTPLDGDSAIDGYYSQPQSHKDSGGVIRTARRSLCFDQQKQGEEELDNFSLLSPPNKDLNFENYSSDLGNERREDSEDCYSLGETMKSTRRKHRRLQVFQDITRLPETPRNSATLS